MIQPIALTALIWMIPFMVGVFVRNEKTGFTLAAYGLAFGCVWAVCWIAYGAWWIKSHLCY